MIQTLVKSLELCTEENSPVLFYEASFWIRCVAATNQNANLADQGSMLFCAAAVFVAWEVRR